MHLSDSLRKVIAVRGEDHRLDGLFSYLRLEERVPANHPLRPIRDLADVALKKLWRDFSKLYVRYGRPSIPPERLFRALLLQAFYTVRSERQLMEQLDYNLLFRWFVGLSIDDPVWDATVFCKNRDRLLDGDIAAKSFCRCCEPAAGARAALERALLGRWHVDRGLGQHEELCAEGWRQGWRRSPVWHG